MRFVHTSDWHLGRRFHGEDLIPAQRAFLDHLVGTARAERADAVLVAGDLYDRAIPPLDAVRLFGEALEELAALGIPTVMISGNHDSAHRLGVGSALLARAGVHLLTDPAACGVPVLLRDAHGPVAVYGIPYLEPSLVRASLGAARASHQAVLSAALDRVRADLAARPAGTRSVVLAHAFVTGAAPSASERDISVGGVPSVPARLFDGIDYAALGHLHRPQRVTDRVRYSGSPLPYSFSEAGSQKSLLLVDLGPGADVEVQEVPCPLARPLARLRGTLDELLADPAHQAATGAWTQITLTDPALPYEAMARLRRRFPHTLQLQHEPPAEGRRETTRYGASVRGREDLDIAREFVAHARGSAPNEEESRLLAEAVEAVRLELAGDPTAKETA
ncbi:exonuclease SbcCD subunit D [Streptomyces hoynatensis]|uniref:Nuclease SbcCD subunit D n=1 Tax=Streptomyces hoynatensis TaxID=1141874 RepID=A0A3A9YRC0_9ACTN|nr:exonuclease SbcCD subunit D [Streptomyces hoynatensis]RKN38530.1 exonuclease SbcCD subunit D [Streptomyces hoynatensis]